MLDENWENYKVGGHRCTEQKYFLKKALFGIFHQFSKEMNSTFILSVESDKIFIYVHIL